MHLNGGTIARNYAHSVIRSCNPMCTRRCARATGRWHFTIDRVDGSRQLTRNSQGTPPPRSVMKPNYTHYTPTEPRHPPTHPTHPYLNYPLPIRHFSYLS